MLFSQLGLIFLSKKIEVITAFGKKNIRHTEVLNKQFVLLNKSMVNGRWKKNP